MAPENLNIVERLAIGFYLWVAALVAFSAYCFLGGGDGSNNTVADG